MHNILIDGLAGVRLAGSLFDSSPDAVAAQSPPATASPVPTHTQSSYVPSGGRCGSRAAGMHGPTRHVAAR